MVLKSVTGCLNTGSNAMKRERQIQIATAMVSTQAVSRIPIPACPSFGVHASRLLVEKTRHYEYDGHVVIFKVCTFLNGAKQYESKGPDRQYYYFWNTDVRYSASDFYGANGCTLEVYSLAPDTDVAIATCTLFNSKELTEDGMGGELLV